MSYTPSPIKGSGQYLKVFERIVSYITTENVEPDDDGYVRGDRTNQYELKAAVVPVDEENLDNLDYGENITGFVNIYIRRHIQREEGFTIDYNGYFKLDNQEWKILSVDDYGTVIKITCGRSEVGGYPVGQ